MRVPTEQRITEWLLAHLLNLRHWTDAACGRVLDPFESHQPDSLVLAESYSPATALGIAARAARMGQPDAGALLAGYCTRITRLLADPATPAWTALFLQYFALTAGEDLRAVAAQDQPAITAPDVEALLGALLAWRDPLETPPNASCAAMQAGVEMLKQRLAGQADWARCKQRLDVVAGQQSAGGFINDDPGGPSVAVAHHVFGTYLLAAALSRAAQGPVPPEAVESLGQADRIVAAGYGWLGHLLANDGMIAQYGRGRYHPFAQAAGVALLAAVGIEAEDATVRRYLAWMSQYRLGANADAGLPGESFATTPNLCPPALRVGFERDGFLSVYNNLAMLILLDALAWWRSLLPSLPCAADARRVFFNTARETGFHADRDVGLARLRSSAGYALVNLCPDPCGHVPAGSLIHLRLGDDLHEKAIPPPFWADPRLCRDAPEHSVWEGPLLCEPDPSGCAKAPPSALLTQSRLEDCQASGASMTLRCSSPEGNWTRAFVLDPGALVVQWRVEPSVAGKRLLAVIPCLLWDGVNQTQLRFDGPEVRATFAGLTWRMTILDAQNQPLPGTWLLTPYRSTASTSGVTGRLQFLVRESTQPGEPVTYTIQIEAL